MQVCSCVTSVLEAATTTPPTTAIGCMFVVVLIRITHASYTQQHPLLLHHFGSLIKQIMMLQPPRRQRSIGKSILIMLMLCVASLILDVSAQDGGIRERILQMDPTGSVCTTDDGML